MVSEKREFKIKKYVSEKKKEVLELLDYTDKLILLESPTSTGKTTLISEIFKTNDYYNNLTCPNRIQVLQNEALGLKPIIGKASYDFMIDKNVCCVFDKINEYIDFLELLILKKEKEKDNTEIKVNFILDEAHNIILAYNYRQKAIISILDLIKFLKENPLIKSNIVFMSATTDCLEFLGFDLKIIFEKEIKDSNVENIFVKSYKYKSQRKRFKHYIIKELLDCETQCLIRYNSKKGTEETIKTLTEEYGKKCAFINSSEKDFTIVDNKIVYKNKYYGEIIQNQTLLKDVDYIFTTSLLDVGTSIVKGDKNLTLFFIIDKPYQMILDNFIQFINRPRYEIKNCNILLNNPEENHEFKTFEEIYEKRTTEAERKKEIFTILIESLKDMNYNSADVENYFNLVKNVKDFVKRNSTDNMINYNKDKIDVDMIQLNLLSYLEYCKLDFYNHQRLLEKIKEKLNTNIFYKEINSLKDVKYKKIKKKVDNVKFKDVIKIVGELEKKEITSLKKYAEHKIITSNDKILKLFKNKFFKECIEICIKYVISIDDFLETIIKTKSQSKTKEWIFQNQIIFYNLMFLDCGKTELIGIIEQQIIIKELYKDNLVKQTITNKRLEKIAEMINQELDTNIYNSELVKKYVKYIFTFEENETSFKIKKLRRNILKCN